MSDAIRVGVLGVGVMGAEHVRLLSREVSGVEVAAMYDLDAARAEAVAATCGAQTTGDPMVLIKDESIDGVLIASSDATHEQLVLAALAARKPVLCEKPLAPEVEACQGILAAETDVGQRLVSLGFMRRFDPGFVALRDDIRASTVGHPLVLHCVHRNAANPTAESASLITGSLVHEIDTVRWLLDEELESVTIHTPRRSGRVGDLQDPIVAVFASRSGVHIDAEVFVNAGYGYDVRCEVVGETGTVLLDRLPETVRRAHFAASRAVAQDWRDRFEDAYRRELQSWVDAVAGDRPSTTATAWDGYVATAVAQAAVRALESGATQPIELIDRPELYS